MTIWRLSWQSALRRRRLFLWNVVLPLLLLAPVAMSDAAAPHRVAVYGVFLVFFGTFGSAIPTVSDARDGWLDEIFRTNYSAAQWLWERTLAETSIDLLQTLPAVLILLITGTGLSSFGELLMSVAIALLFANLVGPVIAAMVKSLAEAALAGAAISLGLLHYAGFFRPPVSGWTLTLAMWNPYTPLRSGLQGSVSQIASEEMFGWGFPLLSIIIIGLLIFIFAGRWTRHLRWPNA